MIIVLVDDGDIECSLGERLSGREPAKPRPDNDDALAHGSLPSFAPSDLIWASGRAPASAGRWGEVNRGKRGPRMSQAGWGRVPIGGIRSLIEDALTTAGLP